MGFVDLINVEVQEKALRLMPKCVAEVYGILPLSFDKGVLTVAHASTSERLDLKDLRCFLGIKEVHGVPAKSDQIAERREKAYVDADEGIMQVIEKLNSDIQAEAMWQ
jgi:hypothetical protein